MKDRPLTITVAVVTAAVTTLFFQNYLDKFRNEHRGNGRDDGGDYRGEVVDNQSANAPSAFIELTPSAVGEAGGGGHNCDAVGAVADSAGNEAVPDQFGGDGGVATNKLNGKRAFGHAVEDASVLRVHTEILTQPESARQRQADNSN